MADERTSELEDFASLVPLASLIPDEERSPSLIERADAFPSEEELPVLRTSDPDLS